MARGFSGSGQYIEMTDATAPAVTNMTISAWIKASALTGTHYIISRSNTSVTQLNFYFRVGSDGHLLFGFTTGSGSYQEVQSAAAEIATGTWYHVVARYDGATQDLFKGGASIGSDAQTGTPDTSLGTASFAIGALLPGIVGEYWAGDLAEVAIWNAGISNAEITSLSKKVSPAKVRPASLVGHWNLIGRDSPETDVRRGNNGTLTGPPTAVEHPPIYRPRRRQAVHVVASGGGGGSPSAFHLIPERIGLRALSGVW
jgi:hypothetical protein